MQDATTGNSFPSDAARRELAKQWIDMMLDGMWRRAPRFTERLAIQDNHPHNRWVALTYGGAPLQMTALGALCDLYVQQGLAHWAMDLTSGQVVLEWPVVDNEQPETYCTMLPPKIVHDVGLLTPEGRQRAGMPITPRATSIAIMSYLGMSLSEIAEILRSEPEHYFEWAMPDARRARLHNNNVSDAIVHG
jgi:hypothetical protein